MKPPRNSLAVMLLLALVSHAGAQTTSTWNLAGDGDWKNAANWNTSEYPDNGQPAPGDTYNAILNTNRTITLDGSVSIQGLTQSTGTITGAADKVLSLAGPLAWSGGAFAGGMTVNANGGVTITNNVNHELNGDTIFNHAGTMDWTAGNLGNNFGNYTFNNQATGVINANFATNQAIGALNGSKTFHNAGSLVKTGAGQLDFQIPFHNQAGGTFDLNGGTALVRAGSNAGISPSPAGGRYFTLSAVVLGLRVELPPHSVVRAFSIMQRGAATSTTAPTTSAKPTFGAAMCISTSPGRPTR